MTYNQESTFFDTELSSLVEPDSSQDVWNEVQRLHVLIFKACLAQGNLHKESN